ncbi:MAG: hypothetical protein EXX96DRAFT_208282 [Benjaminiella poitrasii]|nr:MAG: hypothetical protein EXX96DRAFT_208282 [Benjaminiella poitrasii]
MSASFIQEQHLINNHDGDSKVHKLPTTAITTADTPNHSQVLEIPFELLHTAHYTSSTQPISNIHLSNERTNEEQLSWSTSSLKSTASSLHIETDSARAIVPSKLRLVNGIVTHSFANRKKSITKHRKSVLSHSFTAEEDNGSNMDETIRHDREATLAALERGRIKAIQSTFSDANGEECLREMKKEEEDQEEEIINKKEGKQTISLQHQEETNDCLKEKLVNEDEGYQYYVENSTNIYSQRNITFDLSEDEMENDSTVERRVVQHVLYFSKNHDKTTTVLSIGRGSSVLQKEKGFRKPEV